MRVGKRATAHFFFRRYYPPLSQQSEIKTAEFAGCAAMQFLPKARSIAANIPSRSSNYNIESRIRFVKRSAGMNFRTLLNESNCKR